MLEEDLHSHRVSLHMAASGKKHSVNFVCLGNICRSPMAEAVFKKLLEDRGYSGEWEVDSSALASYNIGDQPDPRTISTLRKYGLSIDHRARQVTKDDFNRYEYLLCFDEQNIRGLKRLQPKNSTATVRLLGSYVGEGKVVQDPYYEEDEAFERTYQLCLSMCTAFLDSVYK